MPVQTSPEAPRGTQRQLQGGRRAVVGVVGKAGAAPMRGRLKSAPLKMVFDG